MLIRFFNTFEPVSPTYRDLLPYLVKQGADVEVVLSSAEYRTGRVPLENSLNQVGVCIIRVPSGLSGADNRLQKNWAMLTYISGVLFYSLFGRSSTINFFFSHPPLFSIWGYVLKILRKQPYCCQAMDIYPDLAVESGVFRKASLLTRLLENLSSFSLGQASSVIVIGRCMRKKVIAKGVLPEKIFFIPNWANEEALRIQSEGGNELRAELGLRDFFIVLYSGNMGVSHYFDDIIEVARRCIGCDGLRFVFIGSGVRRVEIENASAEYGLGNVIILPYQPIERLGESLRLGDVHFISLRSGFEGLVVPSKAYGALAVSRPIIYQGSREGEIARMVEENDIGAVIHPGDTDKLEEVILKYYKGQISIEEQGKRALALAHSMYSYKEAIKKYKALLL